MTEAEQIIEQLLSSSAKADLVTLFRKNPGLIDTIDGVARRPETIEAVTSIRNPTEMPARSGVADPDEMLRGGLMQGHSQSIGQIQSTTDTGTIFLGNSVIFLRPVEILAAMLKALAMIVLAVATIPS